MMKRNACYSILIALLSTLALTACIEPTGLDPVKDPEAKESYGKHSYSGCGDNDKKYEPRCKKPINFDKFAMASRIDSITFPTNETENPIYKVIADIDTAATLVDPDMTVAKKIEEQIGDGRFNLIVEFLGWEKDSERPKDHLPIMLWPGDKPKDGKTEIKTKENGLPSASNDSAFSKSTFINAKYSKEGDEYKVAATSIVPIQFPVLLFRVKTLVEVQKAQLTAKIKKTDDGIEIVEGKISGEVRKDSILNAVYKLQQDCHENYGKNNCIELDPRGQCSVGHADGCKKDGQVDKVCKMAAAICTQEEALLVHPAFKNSTTLEAVIDITGKPIQIDGWK